MAEALERLSAVVGGAVVRPVAVTSHDSAAAEWFVKIRDGQIDAQSDQTFREWMKDEANQRSMEEKQS